MASLENDYYTSWLGNSFGGGDKWVQLQISSLYVTPDGLCFTNSPWDESGREVGIYQEGDVIGKAEALHGWGRNGGLAVTANSNYLYVAMKQGYIPQDGQDYPTNEEVTWYAVRRYHLNGQPAPFAGGRGYDHSMLLVSDSNEITGLATNNGQLYISEENSNLVNVYDEKTMTKLRSFQVSHPGPLTVDSQGNLWVISQDSGEILNYSPQGQFLGKKITSLVDPTALAIDNHGRLLIAENGPAQQVLIYEISNTPQLVDTLGAKGGIYADQPGIMDANKLYGLSGVGSDQQGNIYVSFDGFNRSGATLRKYSPNKNLQWELQGLAFVDNADVDPATDGLDVYTKDEHFVMNYSQSQGKEARYKALTIDPFRYPDDPRLHSSQEDHDSATVFFRRIQGRRFLYITDMYAQRLLIYRFDGEIAVPSGIISQKHSNWPINQPEQGMWSWHDLNGDGSMQDNEYNTLSTTQKYIWGWEVDSQGNIWQASESDGISRYAFQGLDAYGSPIYDKSSSENVAMPQPFEELERIKYFAETDVMYLGGYTSDSPKQPGEWGLVGTEIIRYDNWSQNRQLKWRIVLPHDLAANPIEIIKAMDIAGERVFAVSSRKAEVYVYDSKTGAFLTTLTPKESGWVDTPYGLRAYQRQNGEYVVFVEEDAKAKVTLYRFNNSQVPDSSNNIINGGIGNDSLVANSSGNTINGYLGNDTLEANSSDNKLYGGAGNDKLVADLYTSNNTLYGGTENDLYQLNSSNNLVVENSTATNEIDTVEASFNYTLGNNLENLSLTGVAAINGTGNSLNNNLIGNGANNSLSGADGSDFLDGGMGVDSLVGGLGNDTYIIDNIGDIIVEGSKAGTDSVSSNVNYSLADNLENLTITGPNNLSGIGNTLNNTIIGGSGTSTLIGLEGNDIIIGNAGNDVLIGNNGNDTLTGSAGNDQFVFNAKSERIDTIKDFSTGDIIRIKASGFDAALVPGLLKSNQFVLGNTTVNSNSRFIYQQNIGGLFYDQDGNGSVAQVQIATLSNLPVLSAANLTIF